MSARITRCAKGACAVRGPVRSEGNLPVIARISTTAVATDAARKPAPAYVTSAGAGVPAPIRRQ
jgi:hypothetical protein